MSISNIKIDMPPPQFIELDKVSVSTSNDVEWLHRVYALLDHESGIIAEFLRAYREAEVDDDDYYERTAGKLAYMRIAMKWAEHRLIILGEKPHYSPADPRSKAIRQLTEQVDKLKQRIVVMEKRS